MRYILTKWYHEFQEEPVFIYSEYDAYGWETRKVELYQDGRMHYADACGHSGTAKLAKLNINEANFDEINRSQEFKVEDINKSVFDDAWIKATTFKSI